MKGRGKSLHSPFNVVVKSAKQSERYTKLWETKKEICSGAWWARACNREGNHLLEATPLFHCVTFNIKSPLPRRHGGARLRRGVPASRPHSSPADPGTTPRATFLSGFFAVLKRSWSPQAGRWHVNCGDAPLQDGSLWLCGQSRSLRRDERWVHALRLVVSILLFIG